MTKLDKRSKRHILNKKPPLWCPYGHHVIHAVVQTNLPAFSKTCINELQQEERKNNSLLHTMRRFFQYDSQAVRKWCIWVTPKATPTLREGCIFDENFHPFMHAFLCFKLTECSVYYDCSHGIAQTMCHQIQFISFCFWVSGHISTCTFLSSTYCRTKTPPTTFQTWTSYVFPTLYLHWFQCVAYQRLD